MLFTVLASKSVISQATGTCIGHVVDVDIDPFTLRVLFLKVRPLFNLLNFRGCFRTVIIPIVNVVRVGNDVIIVNLIHEAIPL